MGDPIKCTPPELQKGVEVWSNRAVDLQVTRGSGRGEIHIRFLDFSGCPAKRELFHIHGVSSTFNAGGTTNDDGVVKLEAPIDIYQLQLRDVLFDVAARPTGEPRRLAWLPQSVQRVEPIQRNLPDRSKAQTEGWRSGRQWLTWLTDTTQQKPLFTQRDKGGTSNSVDVTHRAASEDRDRLAMDEMRKGNMPDFCRQFWPIEITETIRQGNRLVDKPGGAAVRLWVLSDLLAIGSDADYLRWPLSPWAAQQLANEWECYLPTPRVTDVVWEQAALKLEGHRIEAQRPGFGNFQRSNLCTRAHEDILSGRIRCQTNAAKLSQTEKDAQAALAKECAGKFDPVLASNHDGACSVPSAHPYRIVAGHKKEIIISNVQCVDSERRASRRGGGPTLGYWGFKLTGNPHESDLRATIHGATYGDYSHGIRLVAKGAYVRAAGSNEWRPCTYPDLLQGKNGLPHQIVTEGKPFDLDGYEAPPAGNWPNTG